MVESRTVSDRWPQMNNYSRTNVFFVFSLAPLENFVNLAGEPLLLI